MSWILDSPVIGLAVIGWSQVVGHMISVAGLMQHNIYRRKVEVQHSIKWCEHRNEVLAICGMLLLYYEILSQVSVKSYL